MITAAQILESVADNVCWERGSEYAWECDAIVSPSLLRDLCKLAAKAPLYEKKKVFTLA